MEKSLHGHALMQEPLRYQFCVLSFSIYINNPADGLSSNPKLSTDDTSLFVVIHGFVTSQTQNFSSFVIFNNNIVSETPYQKHLGIFLDAQLSSEENLKEISTKVNRIVGLLLELQKF